MDPRDRRDAAEAERDDPSWELEPRWSRADRARRDAAVARHDREHAPGVVPVRPTPLPEEKSG
jgi:hypothetical protein